MELLINWIVGSILAAIVGLYGLKKMNYNERLTQVETIGQSIVFSWVALLIFSISILTLKKEDCE